MPDIPIGYLYEGKAAALPHDASYEAFNPHHILVTEELVKACRQRNVIINVWTLNEPQRALELTRMGVQGIITDNPDVILSALKTA